MVKKIIIAIAVVLLIPVIVFFFFPQVIFNLSINSARSSAGLEERQIEAGDNTIAYLEGGEGEVVFLIHGLGGNKDSWPAFAEHLTQDYRVIAIDLPGTGDSTKRETDVYSISAQVPRVKAFLNEKEISEMHLVGHSMGGSIAIKLAAENPGMISSLTLLNTDGVKAPERSEFEKLIAQGRNPLTVTSAEDLDNLLGFMFVNPPSIPGPIKRYLAGQAQEAAVYNTKIFWEIFGYDATSDLRKINTRTLIVWGDTDRRNHKSAIPVLERNLRNSRSMIIEDCGHFTMREKPEETAEAFLSFVKGEI